MARGTRLELRPAPYPQPGIVSIAQLLRDSRSRWTRNSGVFRALHSTNNQFPRTPRHRILFKRPLLGEGEPRVSIKRPSGPKMSPTCLVPQREIRIVKQNERFLTKMQIQAHRNTGGGSNISPESGLYGPITGQVARILTKGVTSRAISSTEIDERTREKRYKNGPGIPLARRSKLSRLPAP